MSVWWILAPLLAIAAGVLACVAYKFARGCMIRVRGPILETEEIEPDDEDTKERVERVTKRVTRLSAEVEVETRRRNKPGER